MMRTTIHELATLLFPALTAIAVVSSGCASSDEPSSRPIAYSQEASTFDAPAVPVLPSAQPLSHPASDVARRQLSAFLSRIPQGQEQRYGFDSRQQFDASEVGSAYRMLTIQPFTSRQQPVVVELSEWRVPVVVQGTYRSLLTVANTGKGLQVVEVGAAALCTELGSLEALASTLPGSVRAIVRVYQLQSDFLAVLSAQDAYRAAWYYPMQSACASLGLPRGKPLSYAELVDALAKAFGRLGPLPKQGKAP